MSKINILGGGSWGLGLALLLNDNGHQVKIWEFNKKIVENIIKEGYNKNFSEEIKIDKSISITSDLGELFLESFDMLVFAVPSQVMRGVAGKVSKLINQDLKLVINVAKGIEKDYLKRMSEILEDELPDWLSDKIATLSGPSHAEEVARKMPTTVVLAGKNDKNLESAQKIFSNKYFRVYTSNDLIGVELGGAVKNIISIAAGIVDGLNLGDNTKGALLTRGIAEIKRLGVEMGAESDTFLGLSGIGDLITTAISKHSRNRSVGFQLAQGVTLEQILNKMKMVAEGVETTKSVYRLKQKYRVSMPITEQIYQVLFNNKNPQKAITDLMTRTLKDED